MLVRGGAYFAAQTKSTRVTYLLSGGTLSRLGSNVSRRGQRTESKTPLRGIAPEIQKC